MPRALTLLAALILLIGPTVTEARGQDDRFTLAIKAGLSAEHSEDNLKGTSPAIGVTGAFHFSRGWRLEGEFWLPGYIDDSRGDPKHRDVLFSVSAVKSFGSGKARPFVVLGTSFTQTQDWFTFCTANRPPMGGGTARPVLVSCDDPDVVDRRRERNDGTDGYFLAGGGVEISLTHRFGIVADVRLSLAPASVIVRPGVGLLVRF